MISASSDQDPGSRRRKAQTHKAKSGPLPAKFFSDTHPAYKIRLVYTQDDCPRSRSFHGAGFEVIWAGAFQEKVTDEYKPNNNRLFDSGHGRLDPEYFSVSFLPG
jgi:hypothetical protein